MKKIVTMGEIMLTREVEPVRTLENCVKIKILCGCGGD